MKPGKVPQGKDSDVNISAAPVLLSPCRDRAGAALILGKENKTMRMKTPDCIKCGGKGYYYPNLGIVECGKCGDEIAVYIDAHRLAPVSDLDKRNGLRTEGQYAAKVEGK